MTHPETWTGPIRNSVRADLPAEEEEYTDEEGQVRAVTTSETDPRLKAVMAAGLAALAQRHRGRQGNARRPPWLVPTAAVDQP